MLFSTTPILSILVALIVPALANTSTARPDHDLPTRTVHRRATDPLPYNANSPAATPAFIPAPIPSLLPLNQLLGLVGATQTTATSLLTSTLNNALSAATSLDVPGILGSVVNLIPNVFCLFGCPPPKTVVVTTPIASASVTLGTNVTCLNSAMNDTIINSLLYYGGADTTVFLCPGAVIILRGPIVYTAARQVITTKGLPTDATRAMLVVTGSGQSIAVYGTCVKCSGIRLANVQINGNRPVLGWIPLGGALLELGGSSSGQVIDQVHSFEPRGWTALHLIEGTANSCSGASVTNSQFGPSGHAPSGPAQFRMARQRKRDSGTYTPGQWADGISVACKSSVISGNTITDAADGGIVIFGAPGSSVTGNTIRSVSRTLLGGINAVDFAPHNGDYSGTVVSANTIDSRSAMIKVGLALGPQTWTTFGGVRTKQGTFTGNTFTSGPTGYFGYAIAISGNDGAIVTGNKFFGANFGGVVSAACLKPTVPFGPAFYNPSSTSLLTLQSSIIDGGAFGFMICNGPGPISLTSVSSL